MAAIDFSQAPWHLVDGVLRNKVSGCKVTAPYWAGTLYNLREVTQALSPKPQKTPRMTVISYAGKYYLKSKTGDVHSVRYASREKAADAGRRIAAGLLHFLPTTTQVNKSNTTNKL